MKLESFKKCLPFLLLLLLGWVLSPAAYGQRICSDPAKPCGLKSSRPYELTFVIPRSNLARAEDKSAAFYGVILRSAKPCSIDENERVSAQQMFPRNKVFVSRFECGEEDVITYEPIDSTKFSVMAVYAGSTKRQAENLLARVQKTNRFPDAYIKRMRAVLVHP
jgi:hypothetical protein